MIIKATMSETSARWLGMTMRSYFFPLKEMQRLSNTFWTAMWRKSTAYLIGGEVMTDCEYLRQCGLSAPLL
jgi:hypothetical protein